MLDKIATTQIELLKKQKPVRVKLKTPLRKVVRAMIKHRQGAAIVEDDSGKVSGMFTERDLITRLDHRSNAWHDMLVDEVMIRGPQTISATSNIRASLIIMINSKLRYLPVVDSQGKALGIVSIRDILTYVVSCYPAEFLNLPPDTEHEVTKRWGG